MGVPAMRIRSVNGRPIRADGDHVLYWMTAARRTRHNFALDRAIEHARALGKPLRVLEALRVGYRWASDRLHRFVLEGMADNRARFAKSPIAYRAYVEPAAGEGQGLLAAMSARASVVVTDDYPCFFLPRMLATAARGLDVLVEAVDGNGILPMAACEKVQPTAYAFRRFLQRSLPAHLLHAPIGDPLRRLELPAPRPLPRELDRRWPEPPPDLAAALATLPSLPIDHAVGRAAMTGGSVAAETALRSFLAERLPRYADERNDPDREAASGLSPWLHFGHVSAHEIVGAVLGRAEIEPATLVSGGNGSRTGWWGASPAVEGFLDQVVTWRELGLNFCVHRPDDYDRYESLPAWARASLDAHASDVRPVRYTRARLEAAETGDDVWNAAQRELVRTGRMHNYLRMLWAKKVLEWSASPRTALATLIELNNRYAVDGRDPNSYSGIFWSFGRYDRPWAPERPIFGVIRYMSSANTKKKLDLKRYLARYGDASAQGTLDFA